MINTYTMFFGLLGVGGLVWYFLYDVIDQVITYMQTNYASYYPARFLSFFAWGWHNLPWFIMLGAVYFVVINTHREGYN